jgi:hypothetical protein
MVNIQGVGIDPDNPTRLGITWDQTVFEEVDGETYVKDVTYTAWLPIQDVRVLQESNRFHCPQPRVSDDYVPSIGRGIET